MNESWEPEDVEESQQRRVNTLLPEPQRLRIEADGLFKRAKKAEEKNKAATARAEAAEGRADSLYRGLCDSVRASGGVAKEGISDTFLILGVPAEMAARKKAQEAAEALVAGLRGALEELKAEYESAGSCDDDRRVTYNWSLSRINAALALASASAGARLKAEALRAAATKICETTEAPVCLAFAHFLDAEADRLTAEAEKEAANG